MKVEDFMTPEVLKLSQVLDRTRSMIRSATDALCDPKNACALPESRKKLLHIRDVLCETEPKLVGMLLEHA